MGPILPYKYVLIGSCHDRPVWWQYFSSLYVIRGRYEYSKGNKIVFVSDTVLYVAQYIYVTPFTHWPICITRSSSVIWSEHDKRKHTGEYASYIGIFVQLYSYISYCEGIFIYYCLLFDSLFFPRKRERNIDIHEPMGINKWLSFI